MVAPSLGRVSSKIVDNGGRPWPAGSPAPRLLSDMDVQGSDLDGALLFRLRRWLRGRFWGSRPDPPDRFGSFIAKVSAGKPERLPNLSFEPPCSGGGSRDHAALVVREGRRRCHEQHSFFCACCALLPWPAAVVGRVSRRGVLLSTACDANPAGALSPAHGARQPTRDRACMSRVSEAPAASHLFGAGRRRRQVPLLGYQRTRASLSSCIRAAYRCES